ncbi:MAG: MFS transporter [Thiothrix sp.]|nr:MAG: MFS transporter [Thiothrix sp.]
MQNAAFWVVISGFFALGAIFGSWQVMMADLQRAFELSSGQLGLTLTLGVVGSFPAMLLTGRLADRWGARRLMLISILLSALAYASFHWVNHYPLLLISIISLMAASGALDVGINAAAVNYEQNTGDTRMSFFHAGYSGMAAVAALTTGFLLFTGLEFRTIYLLVAVLLVCLGLIYALSSNLDHLISHHQADPQAGEVHKLSLIVLFRTPILLLLAAITGLTFFSEGTLEMWSAVYLRLSLDLPTLVGAAGPAVFHFAMMTGRLGSGWILLHWRRRWVLRISGMMAAVGILLSVSTLYPAVILAGFLIAGLALAAVVPIVFSLAGDIAPKQAGQVISVITILGYIGFLLGPSLIGNLADLIGLRLALLALGVAGVGVVLMSFKIQHPVLDQR